MSKLRENADTDVVIRIGIAEDRGTDTGEFRVITNTAQDMVCWTGTEIALSTDIAGIRGPRNIGRPHDNMVRTYTESNKDSLEIGLQDTSNGGLCYQKIIVEMRRL